MAAGPQRVVASAVLAVALFAAAAASAQQWVNPDYPQRGETEPGDPGTGTDDDQEDLAGGDEGKGMEAQRHRAPGLEVPPGQGVPRTAQSPIPRGHLPPPGSCRVWYLERPAGHQPPPGSCEELRLQVPPGAILVEG